MEPRGSLLRLQKPATCPYPEPDQSIPYPSPSLPLPEVPFQYFPPT